MGSDGEVSGKIYVAFLNGYSPSWADELPRNLVQFFPLPAKRLDLGFDLTQSYAADRGQYHATLILAALLRHLPTPADKIVGVTSLDLFIPILTFVFGQSLLDGPGAVVSTYRLRNEFYGLPEDEGLLVDRTLKEVVHELGHAFGLVHCPDYNCVMHASSNVEGVDVKGGFFCTECDRAVAGI